MAKRSYHTLSLQSIDLDVLCEVIDDARTKAAGKSRWLNAINTAYDYLLTSTDTIQIAQDGTALIPSASSDTTYAANGVCQCSAYQNGKAPCWHRAAARILYRYQEALEAEADSLMFAVEAAENRGDWKTYDKLSERWAKVEALLMEMEVA
jgi:hypothetical protein